ncbi:MAG: NFACT family protein [Candidatus Nanoarchaeia archaeon]
MEYIELCYALRECEAWAGSKIQKVYHHDDTFVMHLYKSSLGKVFFLLKIPDAICVVKIKPSIGAIGALGGRLRKFWTNATLKSIELISGERIVKMVITTKNAVNHVYVELFGKGNLVICDSEDKILLPWRSQSFTARKLKRGEMYELPPPRKSVFDLEDNEFYAAFEGETSSKVLAKMGLGKKYALEVCFRASVDPMSTSLGKVELQSLFCEVRKLLEHKIDAAVVSDKAEPFTWASIEGERKPFGSFSEALYSTLKWEKPKSQYDIELEKVEAVIHEQGKSVNKLQDRIVNETKKAEVLYEHYEAIREILQTDVDKLEGHPMVKKVDKKHKTIVLELE